MAATATKLQTTLVIKYKDGVDAKGKEIIKSQRFSKVKTTATEQDIYDVSVEVGKLLGKTLDEVIREDQSGIMNA
ncbi:MULTISPECIES: DUF1659 domain-containing protein [Clostridium]|jgi:hypothetical protein|uniref:DUF1659 domain-containing protein n=1 Tax=Clostridium aciditolerans TaxID=339861 RepID=A0A934HWT7_9CLOT|nr:MULTISPECIES: DUF1659 domain-containing protein [Clostridium]MBI6873454.1 DUF1659 domain-containing protein [Clostridium aciditolerans]MTK12834.1 DUF1659 domain-containing protein [Clostridiaceae bacterium]WML34406.1 DUF1659 domain-containing protein [Clostridium sp. OS1-26]